MDAPELVRGVVLINISLRGLHVTKQPALARPFIRSLIPGLKLCPELCPPLFLRRRRRRACGGLVCVLRAMISQPVVKRPVENENALCRALFLVVVASSCVLCIRDL